jgi:hypothetical protein
MAYIDASEPLLILVALGCFDSYNFDYTGIQHGNNSVRFKRWLLHTAKRNNTRTT